jgi:hypothetical protein
MKVLVIVLCSFFRLSINLEKKHDFSIIRGGNFILLIIFFFFYNLSYLLLVLLSHKSFANSVRYSWFALQYTLNVSHFFWLKFAFLLLRSTWFCNSDDFTTNESSIFKKRNKEFEQFLTQWLLHKSRIYYKLGGVAHKASIIRYCERIPL